VAPHYSFRQLSVRRKAALGFVALSFVAFLAGVLPLAMRTPPQTWPPVLVLAVVAWGAFANAIAVLEIVRSTVASTTAWTDERHFRTVMVAFGAFFVLQLTGVLLALSSYR